MKHTIRHGLDLPTARRVLEKAAQAYAEKLRDYSPNFKWRNENEGEVSFQALGMKASGLFKLAGDAMDIEMDVPFMLKPFRSKAIDVIEREVNKWVTKAKEGAI
jgi:hypothetical protein